MCIFCFSFQMSLAIIVQYLKRKKSTFCFIFSQTYQHFILNHKSWLFAGVFYIPRISNSLSKRFLVKYSTKNFDFFSLTFAPSKGKPPISNFQNCRDCSQWLTLGKMKFIVAGKFRKLTGRGILPIDFWCWMKCSETDKFVDISRCT